MMSRVGKEARQLNEVLVGVESELVGEVAVRVRATRKADGHKGDSVDSDDDEQRYTLDDGAGPCTLGQIMDDPGRGWEGVRPAMADGFAGRRMMMCS